MKHPRVTPRIVLAWAAAGLLAGLATPLRAHDTWLSAQRSSSAPNTPAPLTLRLTTGHGYPRPESPVRPERIASARWRRGLLEGDAAAGTPLESSTPIEVPDLALGAPEDGPLQIGLSLHPLRIELTEPKVTQYLDEIACEGAARLAWDDRAPGVPWREDYSKHAVCWISASESGHTDAPRPMGLGLELVPEVDPGRLAPGTGLRVQALRRGKPLADFALFLIGADAGTAAMQHTDEAGWASWTLHGTGPHLVKGTLIRPPNAEGVWVSDFTTFSFEVRV